MYRSTGLHIPASPSRPGDTPDFGYLAISPAGAAPRPLPCAGLAELGPLGTSLIRVIDEDAAAVGPWNPGLAADHLLSALRHMMTTRALDERMVRAQRQGKISFYMTGTGEEAISIGQGLALRADDMCFPSYRQQGLHVARGRDIAELMCQCLSNTRDMCRGRQMPVMYHWKAGHIFTISGNLGTQLPHAVGWAIGSAISRDSRIAAAWSGEGATAEADYHHAMTFASVYRAPVIINVVNNQWAISTFQSVAGGEQQTFAMRGVGFGMAALRVDGNDLLAIYAATQWAAERARSGHGPTLIEHVTYRAGAHSTSDDPSKYRPKEEVRAFPLGDPIVRLRNHLTRLGEWDDARHAALEQSVNADIATAWDRALGAGSLDDAPRLDPLTLFDDVFEHPTQQLESQRRQLAAMLFRPE